MEDWFQEFENQAAISEPGVLELRLSVLVDEARLQWRTQSNAEFADLKQAQARKLADEFEKGGLTIGPDSLPLWSAAYKPGNYRSWWSFKYDICRPARPALNQACCGCRSAWTVSVPHDGRPMARASGPLRLDLRPPQNDAGNYS